MKLTSPPHGFRRAVGVMGACHNGSVGNRGRGNVGDGVEIGSACGVAYPEPLLAGGFEAGVVPLTFGAQCVDVFFVVCLVADEGAFVDGKHRFRSGENILGDGSIVDVGGRRQLVERQAGDAVDKNVVFVAPVEFEVLLIVLV